METKVIPVTGSNYISPLEERAACVNTRGGYSFYSPINSVEWKNNNIVMKCANNIDIDSDSGIGCNAFFALVFYSCISRQVMDRDPLHHPQDLVLSARRGMPSVIRCTPLSSVHRRHICA